MKNVTPNVNIVYWASEQNDRASDKIVETPWEAYNMFSNTGVSKSDEKGTAIIHIRPSIAYKVPTGHIISKHVHYRECIGKGMLGPVKTHYVK